MEWWQRRKRVFKTRPVGRGLIAELNRTQGAVEGFDLNKYQAAHVVMIGAGGIGSQVASALVRKGIGRLTLIDDDRVRDAATLSRILSPITSRSNCAKDSRMFSVRRPMLVVVLKDWVTLTKVTLWASKVSTSRAKSIRARDRRSIL